MDQSKFNKIFLDLKTLFTTIVTNGDAAITTDELTHVTEKPAVSVISVKTFLTQAGISESDQQLLNQPDSMWKIDGIIDLKLFFHILIEAFFCCPEMKLINIQLYNDKNGYITLEDFIETVNDSNRFKGTEMTEEEIKENFAKFDVDYDDKLSPVEAVELHGIMVESFERSILFPHFIPLLSLVYELDTDKDGKITPEEFKQWLIDLGVSDKVYDQIIQTKQYTSVQQFNPSEFMHFCADVWLTVNP